MRSFPNKGETNKGEANPTTSAPLPTRACLCQGEVREDGRQKAEVLGDVHARHHDWSGVAATISEASHMHKTSKTMEEARQEEGGGIHGKMALGCRSEEGERLRLGQNGRGERKQTPSNAPIILYEKERDTFGGKTKLNHKTNMHEAVSGSLYIG